MSEDRWRVQETAEYLCARNFSVVALQFPDEYLNDASRITRDIHAACKARGHAIQAYILADTSYNSLSVDEVAAAHVNAHCVVHYGRASLTKLSHLPAFFVFPQEQLDVQAAATCLAACSLLAFRSQESGKNDSSSSNGGPVLIFLDQPLLHQLEQFKAALLQMLNQQGRDAAEHLAFPTVPQQHMEPEGQQQRVLPATPPPSSCCGGGSRAGACGSQQLEAAEAEPSRSRAGCESAACCSATETSGAGNNTGVSADASQQAVSSDAAGSAGTAGTANVGMPSSSSTNQHSLAGYQWHLPAGMAPQDCGLVWVGAPDAPALLQLQLTYNACRWAMLDPSLLHSESGSTASNPSASNTSAAAPSSNTSSNTSISTSGSAGTAGTAGTAPVQADCSGALSEGLPLDISRALQRRYFLVEKARDASIVGILVGTLGAAGYAHAGRALRDAAAAAGKKTYTLLMGKPSPAKLANFPEIEVFVLVADPQGQILDSKEYLAPIITPHEAMLAFGTGEAAAAGWDQQRYRLDFEGVLQEQQQAEAGATTTGSQKRSHEPRFSLLSGAYAGSGGSGSGSEAGEGDEEAQLGGNGGGGSAAGTALALHAQQALQLSVAPAGRSDLVQPKSAADYLLHKRSWQGIEAPLVGAAPKAVEAAVEGRSGRAAAYADEQGRRTQQQQ